ncbi:GspH/FimT family pseudopilin [uncultured Psychromonas sp.]|uniref:GspH/FimT family pseudopilin n=1 Tax=uncultured Psychromonas sp. TaxID=173974 RepID=UPI002635F28F|nr:GspH/FimT family pseudopilin [uncultured Psychromonas sp.]
MNSFNIKGLQQGFTLIELLITIAIAAILLTVVVPSFSSLIESSKARTTRDSLISSIYAAKQQAQSERINVYLCSSADAASCDATTSWGADWLVYEDNDSSGSLNSGDVIIINGSSKTSLIKSTENQIKFTPTGHSSANIFKVCSNTDNSIVYEIKLNRMGRVSHEDASGDC